MVPLVSLTLGVLIPIPFNFLFNCLTQAHSADSLLNYRILKGNLAPGGAVAKITGKEGLEFTGKARTFDTEDAFVEAVEKGEIKKGEKTVVVLRYLGPKGGPGESRSRDLSFVLVACLAVELEIREFLGDTNVSLPFDCLPVVRCGDHFLFPLPIFRSIRQSMCQHLCRAVFLSFFPSVDRDECSIGSINGVLLEKSWFSVS